MYYTINGVKHELQIVDVLPESASYLGRNRLGEYWLGVSGIVYLL